MAVLDVPLHIPAAQLRPMLERELRYREVLSVKVFPKFMRIEHDRRDAGEIIAELDSLHEPLMLT